MMGYFDRAPWKHARVLNVCGKQLEITLTEISLNVISIEKELNVQLDEITANVEQAEVESNINEIDLDLEVD